jgi:hypothetical protein
MNELPATPVASLHSYDMCEDGETFLIMVNLADGRTTTISIRPGSPIACRTHCTGECDGTVACVDCGAATAEPMGGGSNQ